MGLEKGVIHFIQTKRGAKKTLKKYTEFKQMAIRKRVICNLMYFWLKLSESRPNKYTDLSITGLRLTMNRYYLDLCI